MAASEYYLLQNLPLTFQERLERYSHLMRSASSIYHANPQNAKMNSLNISSDDVVDVLRLLNQHNVKYILVGGMAVMFHGHIRTTQDMNLWIKNDLSNKKNLINALKDGIPGFEQFREPEFVMGYTTFPYGEKGIVIDLGTSIVLFGDADFDECYERAVTGTINSVSFRVINITDLIAEKTASGQLQDLLDLEHLHKIQKANSE